MGEITTVDDDSIEDPRLLERIQQYDAEMVLHGEHFKKHGDFLDDAFVFDDLGTRLLESAEYHSTINDALCQTTLAVLGSSDLQSLAEHVQGVKDGISSSLTKIRSRFDQWKMTNTRLIEATRNRCNILLEHSKHYDNSRNDKILGATHANIKLSEALFTQRTGVDGVLEGLVDLKEVCESLLTGPLSKDLDGAVESLLKTFMKHEDTYDTHFIAEYHRACREISKQTKVSPSGVINHYSAPLFENKFLVMSGPEPDEKMRLHDLSLYSREFSLALKPLGDKHKATEENWAHFSLPCLTSLNAVSACQLVLKILDTAERFTAFIKNHSETSMRILKMGQAEGVDSEARQLAQITTHFWKEIVFGSHAVLEHAMRVCNNVLTYVARSVSTWENFKANSNASGILKDSLVGAAIIGGGAALVAANKDRSHHSDDVDRIGSKKGMIKKGIHGGFDVATSGTMGALGGAVAGAVVAHRKKTKWDKIAHDHHSTNQHTE